VYLLIGRAALDLDLPHIWEWLAIWGGPTLCENCSGTLQEELKDLGNPTLVSVALEFRGGDLSPSIVGPLGSVFGASARGESSGATTEICYGPGVGPEDIRAIWHPGDP
jgi:hypothetical protein